MAKRRAELVKEQEERKAERKVSFQRVTTCTASFATSITAHTSGLVAYNVNRVLSNWACTTGYTCTPCVRSFTSPDRRDLWLLVSRPKHIDSLAF